MKSIQKWVLLGADTLAGREIRELVEDRKFPVRLTCCGSTSDQRVLSLASEDNFDVFEELSVSTIAGASAVILAGSPEQSAQAVLLAAGQQPQPVLIDVVGHFESDDAAVVRAPAFERGPVDAGASSRQTVAHPAAITLATAFDALHSATPNDSLYAASAAFAMHVLVTSSV